MYGSTQGMKNMLIKLYVHQVVCYVDHAYHEAVPSRSNLIEEATYPTTWIA